MATETLNIVSIDSAFSDPNGAVTDIDEAISGADGNSYGTTTEDDVADFGLTNPAVINDAATVNSVTITLRAQKGGTAGNERWQVDLLIGGVVQGSQQSTGNLTTSFVNYSGINDAGWNSDWTLAQLQGMQVRLTAIQAGKSGTQVTDIDCMDVVVDFTAGAAFTPDFAASRYYGDGTETGAAALAAQDTDIAVDVTQVDVQVQLRVRVDETGGGAGASTDDYAIELSKNSGGYVAITAASSNVKADTGSALSDGSVTTNRVSDGISDPGAGSFVAGEQEAGNGVVEDRQLTADNFTEHVFALVVVRADLAASDTLDFRVTLNGGAPGMTNTVVPRITITKNAWVEQNGSRFREFLGTESAAGWLAAENIDISLAKEVAFRLRFVISNTGGVNENGTRYFWVSKNSGSYQKINDSSEVDANLSDDFADGDPTTEQLTSGIGTFTAGWMKEVAGGRTLTVDAGLFSEFEMSFITTSSAAAGDTYDFKIGDFGSENAFESYSEIPRLTIVVLTVTLSLDGALQAQKTSAASINAALLGTTALTTDTDAALLASATATANLDAALQAILTATTDISAALQGSAIAPVNIDAALEAIQTAAASLDSALQAAKTVSASLDARLLGPINITASLDAALQAARTAATAIDTALAAEQSNSASLDAALSAAQSVTASLDAALLATKTAAASLDANVVVQGVNQVVTSLDAALQALRSVSVSMDAGLALAATVQASLDAGLAAVVTRATGLDASLIVVGGAVLNVSLDAALQSGATVSASLEAALLATVTAAASLDAGLAATGQAQASLDAALANRILATASIESVLLATLTAAAGMDAVIELSVLPVSPAAGRTFNAEGGRRFNAEGGRRFNARGGRRFGTG